MTNIKILLMKL